MRRSALAASLAVIAIVSGCGGRSGSPVTVTPSPTPIPSNTGSPALVGPEGWQTLPASPASPGSGRHEDLFFIDPLNGWVVNARGEVYRTSDAGVSWGKLAQVTQSSRPIVARCVGFASSTLGWIGNLNTTAGQILPDASLFETQDGGVTWSNISNRISGPTVIGLCGMRVVTPRVVVAVGRWGGPAVFVKTTDGGRTWTSHSLEPQVTGIVDIFFFNEQDGLAVGGRGVGYTDAEERSSHTVILATSDGGETWTTRYTSVGSGQWAWKIQFVNDRAGYVTTEGPTPDGVVLKTVDGGTNWRPLTIAPGVQFEAVGFVSPDRGWVGAFATLHSTKDGGDTWSALAFGTRINRMRVISDSLVYAVGDRVYRWTPPGSGTGQR